ncbi:T9SS type A sorting domain-containing protein [bacterium]|nr:T9SS type A sorting domain-containing protein [bacterium]
MFRKITSILLILVSCSSFGQIIEKTYHFNRPIIQQDGDHQRLQIQGTLLNGRPGHPLLPYKAITLCLPPGQVLDRIEVISGPQKTLAGTHILSPAQDFRPASMPADGQRIMSKAIYQSHTPFPAQAHTVATLHYLHGATFVLATVTPVSYIPAKGKVLYNETLTVRLHTKPATTYTQAFISQLPASPTAYGRIEKLAQNPEVVAQYARASYDADDYPLLIITNNDFEASFVDVVDFYKTRGIKATLITLSNIYAQTSGQDEPDQIRNFIKNEVTQHAVEYVLLGGDAEVVPFRSFYANALSGGSLSETLAPADLYFSALDGTWNYDGDSKWGEPGEDDLLPEVAVARWPISTQLDFDNIYHKITQYQDNPVTGELKRVLLAGEKMWSNPLTWSKEFMDLLIGEHADNGYTTKGIPADHDIQKLYEYNVDWDAALLIDKINQGGTAVYHSGHSNYQFNMQLGMGHITNQNFSALNGIDHNYIMVNSQGCQAGGFHVNDCIGEKMVTIDNFACAYVGASQNNWFNEGQTEGPGIHLAREFVSALYGDESGHIADCHLESKLATATWVDPYNRPDNKTEHEPGAQRWVFYALNVLGDPAMLLWTDEPQTVNIDMIGTLAIDAAELNVHVTRNSNAAKNYFCTIVQNNEILAYSRTDSNGDAVIDLTDIMLSYDSAELVVSGYNTLPVRRSLTITSINENEIQPRRLALTANYPNPFNPSTMLYYTLPAAAKTKITIYDISGRRVTELCNNIHSPGDHTIRWNGCDDRGQQVASGLYIARLSTDTGSSILKMTLLR